MACNKPSGERHHEEWVCPPEISHLGVTVLYQAVACWALLQRRAVTALDVSQVFQVTVRRAGDVLHYITQDASDAIETESQMIHCPQGRRKAVWVLSVHSCLFFRQKKTVKVRSHARSGRGKKHRGTCEMTQCLRTWFVSRQPGESMPDMASVLSLDAGATRTAPGSGE